MRTPMNAIIGFTAIGVRAKDAEQKNQNLKKIEEASSHLLGIINDVLDMAKIEANKLELSFDEYNFERTVQRVLSVVNFKISEKRQSLSVNIDANIPAALVGDSQRLAQVITNLLSNAVKFTPAEGNIKLGALLLSETDGVYEIQIEVVDDGIGISKSYQEKIFNAFEQADSGTSREYGGTGLGLVISKNIIEYMGGSIWVESEAGEGSRFVFTFKAKKGEKAPVCGDERVEIAENEFAGKKLLIAEDIEINREILIALLEDTGIIIDCAENGQEAYNMVAESPEKYDIIFMDMQMPKMDGLEATKHIRALPLHSDRSEELIIIAMTANVFKDGIEACYASGMDDHIGKPLNIDAVIEKLRKYLRTR